MDFVSMEKEEQPKESLVLPENVYRSYQGKYFLGQTNMITFGNGYNAWGALINPVGSNVNMFLNAYTISNFSNQPITAEGWLSSILPGKPITSTHFSAGNRSIVPPPMPKIRIRSANFVSETPSGGTYTFVRRVEPNQTLTKHDFQGMYIIPPGSSFTLYFLSSVKGEIQVRVAYGWWEES